MKTKIFALAVALAMSAYQRLSRDHPVHRGSFKRICSGPYDQGG
jgi:hypothetical protein